MHTPEPLVPEPSDFDIEMVIKELKRHKSQGTDQIPTELINTSGRKIRPEIHKHINSTWNKEGFGPEWKE
jgi:hypothetical protein